MLKQKPTSYYQSSIFAKKPKKRSTSTSANKENLSITHNNSILIQPNTHVNSKSHLNSKPTKNPIANKQKSKKTKKSQSRQRSTSKLPLTNNLVQDHNKQTILKLKQSQIQPKKVKKSRNNSSSIIYAQNQSKPFAKSFINQSCQLLQIKNHPKHPNMINNFLPQMSKSSTIVSSSTGNIQFSQWSREDQHDKNYDLLSINNLMGFNKQVRSANNFRREEYVVKSARERPSVNNMYKLTPVRAAIMIQKTWRGYMTRKLLSEYINSFEPLYEQQLKDIRSGRQSRNQAKSMISSNIKCHQRSSFFDKSQLEQCSQIQPIESQVSQSFRTTSKLHNETSSLMFTQHNQQLNQSSKLQSQLRQSITNNLQISSKVKGNEESCNIPVQFFKKPVVLQSTTKRDESSSVTNESNQEFSCSSRRKNAMKITPQTASRVSEFTVKHSNANNGQNTTRNTSHKQQPSIQQTLKHPRHKPTANLQICPKTTSLSISPFSQPKSPISQLQTHCKSLSSLFHSFNSMCISELKTQIKLNRLSVNELMQRKDALKDIVDNGMEFVKNVEEEIAKAFKEMNRIVKEGCDSSSQRQNNNGVYASETESPNDDSSAERPQISKTINPKNLPNLKNHSKQSPQEKISNEKYIHDLQSPPFSYDSQIDSSSSSRKQQNKRHIRQNKRTGTSQFYTIDLPTEEYSAKGKSPIQEDYDQEESYREEDYQQNDEEQEEEYASSRTLRMNPLYATHQQSLQILNQFLLNLIQQYQQTLTTKPTSQLQYLCQTLKRVSCDSQNKTIIDRCLIEFIVQIMSETWTLRQIYDGFRKIVQQGITNEEENEDQQQEGSDRVDTENNEEDWKLLKTVRRWIEELYKWQMNIIQEVPSKMESSSFINTENISLINTENISVNDLRQVINNLSHPNNFQLDLHTNYK